MGSTSARAVKAVVSASRPTRVGALQLGQRRRDAARWLYPMRRPSQAGILGAVTAVTAVPPLSYDRLVPVCVRTLGGDADLGVTAVTVRGLTSKNRASFAVTFTVTVGSLLSLTCHSSGFLWAS